VKGHKFNIWNVHLQDGETGTVRERQISELIGWITNAYDGQVADIVGGDFNSTPDSRDFGRLVAGIGPDVHQLAGDKPFPTWDGLKLAPDAAQSLDHIFIKLRQPEYEIASKQERQFTAARPQDRLSDHMAMEASLRFRNVLEIPTFDLLGQGAEIDSFDSFVLTAQ
jgi:endonuclease/exonuclease/phosphatase (EEP) superfamily protein YafD